jgi:energy-converting hydrogenase Eha subunit C
MSQDTFNKIITVSLMLYAMVMFTISFVIQRPLDLSGYSVLIAPVVTHTIHLIVRPKDAPPAG